MKRLKSFTLILASVLITIGCSRPEITEVYWATDAEGTRLEGGANRGDVIYGYITTENAEGVQIHILIREADVFGDETCLDTYTNISDECACVQWTVGEGDPSIEIGQRMYYVTGVLQSGNTAAVHSDFIYVDW